MIYETTGLTLEEVDELYLEVKSARESVRWSPKGTFAGVAEKGDGSAGILERTEKGNVGEHREIGAPDGVFV